MRSVKKMDLWMIEEFLHAAQWKRWMQFILCAVRKFINMQLYIVDEVFLWMRISLSHSLSVCVCIFRHEWNATKATNWLADNIFFSFLFNQLLSRVLQSNFWQDILLIFSFFLMSIRLACIHCNAFNCIIVFGKETRKKNLWTWNFLNCEWIQ